MRPLYFAIIGLTLLFGCNRPAENPHRASPAAAIAEAIPVFSDRQDARYEWVFALRGQEIVAQRHVFPGYTDATIVLVPASPAPLLDRLRRAAAKPGDLSPPFPPPGPWFCRADVPLAAGAAPSTQFFANDNSELQELFSDLRAEVSRSGKPVSELPDWVRANVALRKYFGPFK